MERMFKERKINPITSDELRRLVNYDPETGKFVWLVNYGDRRKIGDAVGWKQKHYMCVEIKRNRYLLHRLAWLYVYGEFPDVFVDHINCDALDNRIANLRLATKQQNMCNRGATKSNKSGFKGVWKCNNKYRARIMWNGEQVNLGYFKTPEEANEAYAAAAIRLHGEFAKAA